MANYKLIKTYPGSPKLGYISKSKITPDDGGNTHYWMGSWFRPENFPDFWEIVNEPPKYVECIFNGGTYKNDFIIGDIYEVTKIDDFEGDDEDVFIKGFDEPIFKGLTPSKCVNTYLYTGFKASTKAAFERQTTKKLINSLVVGEIYWSNNSAYPLGHIWKFKMLNENKNFIYTYGQIDSDLTYFCINKGLNDAQLNNLRLATDEEKIWLETCIRANKFISLENVLSNQYKAGDFITILETTSGGSRGWWNQGDVYELTSIDHYSFAVKKFDGTTNGWNINAIKFRLSTPEEIHISKLPNLEVGKWYYFESYDERIKNIAKCDELKDTIFHTNNWIMVAGTSHNDFGTWYLYNVYNIKEMSIEEIQPYLPIDHPEKIIQVGDWVITTTLTDRHYNKYNIGEIFQVIKISDDGEHLYFGPNNSVRKERCRLAIEEEIENATTKTLVLGTSNILINIGKNKITANEDTIPISTLEDIYEDMTQNLFDDCPWDVSFPIVKIGCSEFRVDEIRQVIEEYYKLNN